MKEPGPIEEEAVEEVFHEVTKTFPLVSKDEISNELLHLNINDPREKLLYFRSEADANGALRPKASSYFINAFYNKFDMKYMVVQSYAEICEEIQEAA